MPLAHVPFERVIELAPWLDRPRPFFPLVNYFDGGVGPLAPLLTNRLDGVHLGAYSDGRVNYPLGTLVVDSERPRRRCCFQAIRLRGNPLCAT